MSEAEIHYIVPDANHRQPDVEQILDAISSYQDALPFNIAHTATISEDSNSTVTLGLIRSSKLPQASYVLREYAEQMRNGVESHFSDDDRARLSQLFAGIAITSALETE